MNGTSYDVAVIGGGPGGYVCAIKAAQLGLSVACIEERGALGGTCLNVGCIPSKALLASSEHFEAAKKHFGAHGVKLGSVDLDLAAMMARKSKVVADLVKGIEFLFKKNKVDYLKGHGAILAPGRVAIIAGDGARSEIAARHIVIATGSTVTPLPGIAIDEERILSSTGALALNTVPKHMVVIGAGVIGLELGSVWRRLGAKVTVIEFLDRILPATDAEIAAQFQKLLARQGLVFRLGHKVTGAERQGDQVKIAVTPVAGGAAEDILADALLVAIGRQPYTSGLGLEKIGLAPDAKGRIPVDANFATAIPGLYAIGDVIQGPMLAHKAEEEGIALAEILAGGHGHVNYATCPNIVYTAPELATIGMSEEEAKAAGIAYRVGKFPMLANSRAKAAGETEGLVKLIAAEKDDRLLGAHIIAAQAGTMIHECVMAMEFQASAEDVARAFHGHPTHNEAIKEAAFAVGGKPIHG